MIKYQLQRLHLFEIQTLEVMFYRFGKITAMIKAEVVKKSNSIKATKSSRPTSHSGATMLPPIGKVFLYIESSSNNHGNNVFVSFERTDIIQITNITFYYNRFSILTNDSLKSMGRFRFQLILEDNTWSNLYNIPKMIDIVIHQQIGPL